VKPRALLVDFGGVLTTDVFASFRAFCEESGLPAEAIREAFADEPEAQRLLVGLETGAISEAEFDRAFAALLGGLHGIDVSPTEVVERMNGGLALVERMVEAIAGVRAAGVPTALVSNSMGYGAYDMLDLDACFDVVILSGRIGVRKPSRRIYAAAAEALGVDPPECVLVDDLEQNLSGAARLGVVGILHRETDPEATVAALEEHFGVSLSAAAYE
jgi:putative hydrolase of the HAD superfamily